jgi:membrane-anchored protein YejM (alkaline phosphatase superfamily)
MVCLIKNPNSLIAFAFIVLVINYQAQAQDNVILFGWDGAGRMQIQRLGPDNLPNLYGLNIVSVDNPYHSVTCPGWTMVFTGLPYSFTGVYTNPITVKLKHPLMPVSFVRNVPYEDTLTYHLQSQGHQVGMFVSKTNTSGNCQKSPLCNAYNRADVRAIIEPKDAGDAYLEELKTLLFNFINLNKDRKFFAFFHCNPDYYGHKFGESSERYENEIKTCDKILGETIELLKSYGIDSNTRIFVTADHGFNAGKKNHGNAPESYLASDLSLKRPGTLLNVFSTILDALNIFFPNNVKAESLLTDYWKN